MRRKVTVFLLAVLMIASVAALAYGIPVERFIDNMYDSNEVRSDPGELPLIVFDESAETEGMLRFFARGDDYAVIFDTFELDGMVDVAYFVATWEEPGVLSAEAEAFFEAFFFAPVYNLPSGSALMEYTDEVMDRFKASTQILDDMMFSEVCIEDYVLYVYAGLDGVVLMHIFQFDMFSPESGVPYAKELLREQRIRTAFGCEPYSYEWYLTLLDMTPSEIAEASGMTYEKTGSGVEGCLPGYTFDDMDITLGHYAGIYDNFESIDFIECWGDARVGDYTPGMTFREIEALLGPPDDTFEGNRYSPNVWMYVVPPFELYFFAFESLDYPTYMIRVAPLN